MGSNDLRKRKVWQDLSGEKAKHAEYAFFNSFEQAFENTDYRVYDKPKNFSEIYVDYPLNSETKKAIYSPPEPITKHGISPDYVIENKVTKKKLFVEIKRQDGWVEGKPRSAGRGNAHERLCKYFTPGLLKIIRKESMISEPGLPFWVVFVGDITRDPCRVREVTCWFDNFDAHYFFWREDTAKNLINHFDHRLKDLLC